MKRIFNRREFRMTFNITPWTKCTKCMLDLSIIMMVNCLLLKFEYV